MRKGILWALVLVISFSMAISFSVVGCKEEAAPAEEAAEEAAPAEEAAEEAETMAPEDYEIVTVFKRVGEAWADSIGVGMDKFAADTGVNAYMIGAETADPVAQVALVEDLIAKGVDAILVVPNDPGSLEPSLQKATDAGILTFSHEGAYQKNVVFDLEAFDNFAYGAHMMDKMAEWMNEEGEYACFVQTLATPAHNQWVDGEIARQEEAYPNMSIVADRIEEHADQQEAYEKALEVLATYPNIKGLMGSSMMDVAAFSQAIQEKGLTGQVGAFGTCLPSVAGDYIKSGEAVSFHFWVPEYASYALAMVAWQLLQGNEITVGMDLGVPGYESITIEEGPVGEMIVYGSAWVDINKDTLDDWVTESGDYKL